MFLERHSLADLLNFSETLAGDLNLFKKNSAHLSLAIKFFKGLGIGLI
jgi:hypothetical protein